MAGKLIVFEGGEGCGKSTQLQVLYQYLLADSNFQSLQQQRIVPDLIVTREPGGTNLGLQLRQMLLDQHSPTDLGHRAELLLYAADRAQHVEEVIRPALQEGSWVLCDRFVDSTMAYQGYGRGLDPDLIHQLNAMATDGLEADLTLWLALEAATGLARTRQRGQTDRMEQVDLAFHQRVQAGFETLAQQHPDRITKIDAAGTIETVTTAISAIVNQHLYQWYEPYLPS